MNGDALVLRGNALDLGQKQTITRQFMDAKDDGKREHGMGAGVMGINEATITGYACACTPFTDHPHFPWDSIRMILRRGLGTLKIEHCITQRRHQGSM